MSSSQRVETSATDCQIRKMPDKEAVYLAPEESPAIDTPDSETALVSERIEGVVMPLVGRTLFQLYSTTSGVLRSQVRKLVLKWEKGPLFSRTIRNIFSHYHGVHVGMYSGKGCFVPNNFRDETRIGRYCTIYSTAQAFNANHAMNLKSSSALFYNSLFALTDQDLIERSTLTIGNDVFIGHNAILLPPVHHIGDGAVIGAGAVVNQDVPPYAVVTGNPARVVRFRFPKDVIERLLREQWWNKPLEQLRGEMDQFKTPLDGAGQIR